MVGTSNLELEGGQCLEPIPNFRIDPSLSNACGHHLKRARTNLDEVAVEVAPYFRGLDIDKGRMEKVSVQSRYCQLGLLDDTYVAVACCVDS